MNSQGSFRSLGARGGGWRGGVEGGGLGEFVRMPGWVHNSGHLGIREPWGKPASSYLLSAPLICVEILRKVIFSFP